MRRRMTINDMMQKSFWDTDIPDHPAQAWEQGYRLGANTMLEEIEKYIDSIDWVAYPVTNVARLQNKIKELKGGNK